MFTHGLRERAEYDSFLLESGTESRLHRNGIEDGIHSHTCEGLALVKRYSQFVESLFKLGINLFRAVTVLLRSSIIYNVLKINLRDVQMPPRRDLHPLPLTKSVQTEIQQPLRFLLFRRDETYDFLIQTLGNEFLFEIRHEPVLIFLSRDVLDYIFFFCIFFAHI